MGLGKSKHVATTKYGLHVSYSNASEVSFFFDKFHAMALFVFIYFSLACYKLYTRQPSWCLKYSLNKGREWPIYIEAWCTPIDSCVKSTDNMSDQGEFERDNNYKIHKKWIFYEGLKICPMELSFLAHCQIFDPMHNSDWILVIEYYKKGGYIIWIEKKQTNCVIETQKRGAFFCVTM